MLKPLHLLLVEDSEDDAQLVLRELRRLGYEADIQRVETAEAMQLALKQKTWDLIISDYSMPTFNAPQALEVLNASGLDLPFIIISGTIGEETAVAALKAGANDFLVKGKFARLGPAIERELREAETRREHKRVEEMRAADEHRFRALIENAPDGITMVDINGIVIYVSPSVERILGYSQEEALGQKAIEYVHPEDSLHLLRQMARLTKKPSQVLVQHRFKHKDGSWRWLESTISNLITEPSVGTMIFNYRDITERKQAEEKIQRQLKRLSALRDIDLAISSSFDLNLTLDVLLNATVSQLDVSAAAILLFNQPMSSLEFCAGKGFHSSAIEQTKLRLGEGFAGDAALQNHMVHVPNLAQVGNKFIRAELLKEEGFVSYYAMPLVAKGKLKGVLEIFHRTELHPDQDWSDFFYTLAGQAGIAIDSAQLFENLQRSNFELERRVTARTAELNRTNIELEHANRAKDEFLANMSHELRTPLNSILGLSESLLEQHKGTLNETQQKSLQIIEASGKHLLDLINDVLDLSKIEAGKFDYYPQPVKVDDLCKSSMIFVKSQAVKKGITLTYKIEDSISEFSADPRRLKQILVNLLTNAVKFTLNNGHVTLHVTANPEQEIIKFSVIDTGIGIAQEDLQRLFTPFVQVDSSLNRHFEGTGLGLALIHKLTDLHGGSIEVESEVGKGSRFTVNLPYKQEDLKQADNLNDDIDSQSHNQIRGRKVLLVEDNASNILTIGEYLENHGYEILIANDGLQAIEKAGESLPHIILMDIQMPILDGLEATRRLRTDPRFASTPIIALTALAMPGDRERCLQAGASEYMSKPVSLKELRRVIEGFLNSPN